MVQTAPVLHFVYSRSLAIAFRVLPQNRQDVAAALN